MHPLSAVRRIHDKMVLLILSVIFAGMIFAISIVRRHISYGRSAGAEIAREEVAIAKDRAEHSRVTGPIKQFSVVVLPDGKVISPRITGAVVGPS